MPDQNLTITAVYRTPTIDFYVDGSVYASISQPGGTAITAPADPTKTGYSFTGWSPSLPATMPYSDSVYEAQFTVNQYTLTFKVDDEVYFTITDDYGATITAPSDPSK